jgi:integrase
MQVNSNKTPDTIAAYIHRGQNLWKKAASDLGNSVIELKPNDFISWLEDLFPNLKPASRRQYIAASREWLNYIQLANLSYGGTTKDLTDAIKASLNLKSADYISVVKQKKYLAKTSGQKAKKICPAELQKLAKNEHGYGGKWRFPAIVWMAANILVGLRPCEWRTARLMTVDGILNLEITNAKNTNNRSHGMFRHLDISALSKRDLDLIKGQLQSVRYYTNSKVNWETYSGGVRRAIRCLTRVNLPKQSKYPTLYSSRHQFAANAKSGGLTKPEIAALMGHATDETATMHYGKKRHGSGSFTIKASPDEVARVRLKPEKKSSYTAGQVKAT